jgi:hypothetical protein
MDVRVEIWLRDNDLAATRSIEGIVREPRAWTDQDVRLVIEGMLREMHRLRNPGEPPPAPIALRGLSWIVNRFPDGGVVIAIEITMGAAVAGPFDIEPPALEAMVARVMGRAHAAGPNTIH